MTPQVAERRKRARMALRWPVRLARLGEERAIESETENLSSHGFYCLAQERFEPGELLECLLWLPASEPSVRAAFYRLLCRAVVLRVEGKDPGFGLACRIDQFSFVAPPAAPPSGP